jgi:type III pantothenate kinase
MTDSSECITVAVDIGNTSTHLAAYRTSPSSAVERLGPVCRWSPDWTANALISNAEGNGNALSRCWAIASVNSRREEEFNQWLADRYPRETMQHLRRDQVGIAADLHQFERVGIDRLLAAAAAVSQPPFHVPKIIVDVGTAITVDLIDAKETFQGGAILAGMRATTIALSELAERLPEIPGQMLPKEQPPVVGKNTEEALASGLYWGTVGAIRETIQQMTRTLDTAPAVFRTGSDAEHLPLPGEWVPDLVLVGIAQVGQTF